MFLGKGVLKICSKFTGEHPCRGAISVKLLCNFNEIALRHGCSPVNLLHIFRTPFLKNVSRWLLLTLAISTYFWKQFAGFNFQISQCSNRPLISATLLTIIPLYTICICSKIWFLKIFVAIAIAVLRFRIFMVVWNEKWEEISIKLHNENRWARPRNDYFATVGHPVLSD